MGSKKEGRLCFLGGRVPVEPLVQALPYPPTPGQGVDDSWAHGLMRQLGQHLGQGSCCPARWFLQGREAFRSCDMAVVLCLGQQRQSASRTLQCCLTEGPPLPHWGCSPHHWPGVRRSVLPWGQPTPGQGVDDSRAYGLMRRAGANWLQLRSC